MVSAVPIKEQIITAETFFDFAEVQVHGSKLYGVINAKVEEVMPIQYTEVCLSDYVCIRF